MVIKQEGKEFITIETTRQDAVFLLNSLILGFQNLELNQEDRTRLKNFIDYLGEILNNKIST